MPQRDLQELNIDDLVRALHDERGKPLEITLPNPKADPENPSVATANLNGRAVAFETDGRPENLIGKLLAQWPESVTINGEKLPTSQPTGGWPHRLLVKRQRMGVLGEERPADALQEVGAPTPGITALGLCFDTPTLPGGEDWRAIYLGAPDPEKQWILFGMNAIAVLTPEYRIPEDATGECTFLAHQDVPYISLGAEADAAVDEQSNAAIAEACEKLTDLTGATGWSVYESYEKAGGTHAAVSFEEDERITPRPGTTIAIVAHHGGGTSLMASAARAMYRNPETGVVPVGGFYGAGASVTAVIQGVARQPPRRLGDSPPTRQSTPDQPSAEGPVASAEILIEFRPLRDGVSWQSRVPADVILTGHGQAMSAAVTDQFSGDLEELTRLIAHANHPYIRHQGEGQAQRDESSRISALRGMGQEDEAFQMELDRMARQFEATRISRPTRREFIATAGTTSITWRGAAPQE